MLIHRPRGGHRNSSRSFPLLASADTVSTIAMSSCRRRAHRPKSRVRARRRRTGRACARHPSSRRNSRNEPRTQRGTDSGPRCECACRIRCQRGKRPAGGHGGDSHRSRRPRHPGQRTKEVSSLHTTLRLGAAAAWFVVRRAVTSGACRAMATRGFVTNGPGLVFRCRADKSKP